mmetsp:Transcript_16593/g.28088  ORF Transcript_16593/g.28088 Transcript_16593/m.28088 type:complete len:646 (-) Transcript_16593:1855-3792(-)|eukprot:CAMPEP_0174967498 /NCGR_PEP_ID=MMETSP0004_2-20121128/7616_1 /TAXON_ID=420556 /ORGANISM="Ochromonas sp., Strain CCMP1393" /LENGTH=645 /DNA_ID=CAMNT_0016216635 /DNA_START=41 /DNA_END=1978 /DNA_ORIENTATION=+
MPDTAEADQYHPLPGEFVATGLVGLILYTVVIYFAVESVKKGIKSKSTKRFFYCVICMALLELPRYFVMAVQRSYTSTVAYCFHLLAGIFFFVAFSIVCRQWSGLLQLGSYFRAVYGLRGLVASNISFAVVDVVAVVACASASSLYAFFNSTQFEVITFIEGVRNVVYSTFLAFYGVKLVRRFWHFSRIERQAATRKDILAYICYCTPTNVQDAVFTTVVLRMTSVLVLSSICFILRVCMLIAKMVAVHNTSSITSPEFTLFGFLWFCCSDFLPRTAPTLAFIFLMRTKRPAKDMKQTALHKHAPGDDDFQFVQLSGNDDPYFALSTSSSSASGTSSATGSSANLRAAASAMSVDLEQFEGGVHSSSSSREGSMHGQKSPSTTEIMLKADHLVPGKLAEEEVGEIYTPGTNSSSGNKKVTFTFNQLHSNTASTPERSYLPVDTSMQVSPEEEGGSNVSRMNMDASSRRSSGANLLSARSTADGTNHNNSSGIYEEYDDQDEDDDDDDDDEDSFFEGDSAVDLIDSFISTISFSATQSPIPSSSSVATRQQQHQGVNEAAYRPHSSSSSSSNNHNNNDERGRSFPPLSNSYFHSDINRSDNHHHHNSSSNNNSAGTGTLAGNIHRHSRAAAAARFHEATSLEEDDL